MKIDKSHRLLATHLPVVVCSLLTLSIAVHAQEAAAPDAEQLDMLQAQVSDKYARLEALMLRMAEFDAATNPSRAQILKKAYALSKQDHVGLQLETIVKLLEQDKLSRAIGNQKTVGQDLEAILKLLLTENRSDRLKNEQARVQEYLKELERIIRGERWLRSRTENGDDANRLADQQHEIQQRTGSLGKEMDANEGSDSTDPQDGQSSPESGDTKQDGQADSQTPTEGTPSSDDSETRDPDSSKSDTEKSDPKESDPKESDPNESDPEKSTGENAAPDAEGTPDGATPSDQPSDQSSPGSPGQPSPPGQQSQSPPPSDSQQQQPEQPSYPGRQRVERAQQKMGDAEQRLREAQREQAEQDQQEAIRELEQAKAELEEILRQLREEEIERTLAQLDARFRKMLDEQTLIYEKTQSLDRIAQEQRGRQLEMEAGKLGFQERRIVRDAESALALLREEGSSVAFPESVEQMRDDMQQVAQRLVRGKVSVITQGIEEDIIAALEEMIEALQMAAKDQEERRNQQQSQPSDSDQDQSLVNQIAELKMLRALQSRINRRTTRYSQLLEDVEDPAGQATDNELVDALQNLAQREGKLHKITREIVLGKNE